MDKIKMCNQRSEKGFTLVETLISLVVLSILAVSFFQLINWNSSATFLAREKSNAIVAVQEKLDFLTVEILQAAVDEEPVLEKLAGFEGYRESKDDLFLDNDDLVVFYCEAVSQHIEDLYEVNGYQITVVSFYTQDRYHVRLDYFIEG